MAKAMVVLTGDKALNRMLRSLSGKDGKKAIRKATRPALKVVQAEAKALAPRATGALARAIRVRALPRSRRRVGARVTIGAGEFTGETFYGGFQEWGWKAGGRQIAGKRFLRNAADNKRREAMAIYRRRLKFEIVKLAKMKGQR